MSSPEDARDEVVEDEPPEPTRDPEVPEADALDQAREVAPGERHAPLDRPIEVPEADAIDQAIEVPLDEDDDPAGGDGSG